MISLREPAGFVNSGSAFPRAISTEYDSDTVFRFVETHLPIVRILQIDFILRMLQHLFMLFELLGENDELVLRQIFKRVSRERNVRGFGQQIVLPWDGEDNRSCSVTPESVVTLVNTKARCSLIQSTFALLKTGVPSTEESSMYPCSQ